jgi:hypothetical protein
MSGNAEIIQKADLALSDIASAGKLNTVQTDRFIRVMLDAPTLLGQVRTVAMPGPTMKINKIGFGSRILRSAAADAPSGTGLSQGNRSKPDFGKVDLATSEVIAEVRIPYDVMEDNIERGSVNTPLQSGGGGIHSTIVDMIAERCALDLEELSLSGDTASGDSFLAMQNGFLKLANANVVNVGGAFNKDACKSALKTMPTRYLRDRAALKHFVSVDNETEYRDTLANRQTALGDAQVQGNLPVYAFGSKVESVALMPGAQGLFTDPRNLIFGVQRNIMMEYTKDISGRVFVIVVTARVAFAIEEVNALVKYTGLTGSR